MSRDLKDWLHAYVNYASFSEAPRKMHFWSGVSAIAGALRRRVWIDQAYFRWHCNHYIIFVAPPGVVSKSTTISIAMDILRKVPGVNFGPDVVTWPALVSAFAACTEQFPIGDEFYTQCALTLASSEFGNLINPADREMVDLLVSLWDSQTGAFKKATKNSGNDQVENPWINMIACTTPAWIAGNFPDYVIGGGFTSRCLFVYADRKEKFVAYPSLSVPKELMQLKEILVRELENISQLSGPYTLTPGAYEWGEAWYKEHQENPPPSLKHDDRFGGYLARKQTHLHKLAMVIAASCRDERVIEMEDLISAAEYINGLEADLPKVFSKIGRTQESIHAEKFINYVRAQNRPLSFEEVYTFVHVHFPKVKDFEDILAGALRSQQVQQTQMHGKLWLVAGKGVGDYEYRESENSQYPKSPDSNIIPFPAESPQSAALTPTQSEPKPQE